MRSKSILFIVISTLLVAAIYSSSTFIAFAKPPINGYVITCTDTSSKKNPSSFVRECCQTNYVKGKATDLQCKKNYFIVKGGSNNVTDGDNTRSNNNVTYDETRTGNMSAKKGLAQLKILEDKALVEEGLK